MSADKRAMQQKYSFKNYVDFTAGNKGVGNRSFWQALRDSQKIKDDTTQSTAETQPQATLGTPPPAPLQAEGAVTRTSRARKLLGN